MQTRGTSETLLSAILFGKRRPTNEVNNPKPRGRLSLLSKRRRANYTKYLYIVLSPTHRPLNTGIAPYWKPDSDTKGRHKRLVAEWWRHEKVWYISFNRNALWEDIHSSSGYNQRFHNGYKWWCNNRLKQFVCSRCCQLLRYILIVRWFCVFSQHNGLEYRPGLEVRVSSRDPPYMSPLVKHLCKVRNKTAHRGSQAEKIIRQERINALIRMNKVNAVNNERLKHNRGSKGWWDTANSITGRKKQGTLVSSVISPDVINTYFQSINTDDEYEAPTSLQIPAGTRLPTVNECDVRNLLSHLKRTASGPDEFPYWF